MTWAGFTLYGEIPACRRNSVSEGTMTMRPQAHCTLPPAEPVVTTTCFPHSHLMRKSMELPREGRRGGANAKWLLSAAQASWAWTTCQTSHDLVKVGRTPGEKRSVSIHPPAGNSSAETGHPSHRGPDADQRSGRGNRASPSHGIRVRAD